MYLHLTDPIRSLNDSKRYELSPGIISLPGVDRPEITMRGSDVSVGRPPGIDRSLDSETDRLSIGSVCHVLQN